MDEPREIGPTAGIVRTVADDVLDRVEGEADAAAYRVKFFEGERLKAQEYESRCRALTEIARECNKRLESHQVEIVGAYPERFGFGARFVGKDTDGRDYAIDFKLDDQDRMDGLPFESKRVVAAVVMTIVGEVVKQRRHYLSRMTGVAAE